MALNKSPQSSCAPLCGTNPENYVPSSPAIDQRKFIHSPDCEQLTQGPDLCFSVVSYNILADCHIPRWDYSYTEPQFLDQMYRHNLLMKELAYLDGDIVCMQEVSPDYYKQTLCPAMISLGYEGHYIRRTKDYYDEGSATFIKTLKFDIESTEGLSLTDLAFKEIESANLNENVTCAVTQHLDRADVILLSKLVCKKTGKILTVCNIHVVYDEAAPDVQCAQVTLALKELLSKADNVPGPHIICGDFNVGVKDAAYHLVSDGRISEAYIEDFQSLQVPGNIDGFSCALIQHMPMLFEHSLPNIHSAYLHTQGQEPGVTCYTCSYHNVLDYIFFSADTLTNEGVLQTLDQYIVDNCGGCPTKDIPSDHLSLKAVFSFI